MHCTNPYTPLRVAFALFIISQVSAEDKASGKVQKITITSDKGRLSEDDIERMIREAEENAEADKVLRQRVEAKNQLESYLYGLRNTVDDTLKDKIEAADKETLSKTVTDALSWLEEHPTEEKDAYDEKRKEVEAVANPIISKAYQGSAPGAASAGDSSGSPDEGDESPTVEEADWAAGYSSSYITHSHANIISPVCVASWNRTFSRARMFKIRVKFYRPVNVIDPLTHFHTDNPVVLRILLHC